MIRLPQTFRNRLALAMGAMALLVGLPVYLYIDHVYGQQLLREREQALQDLARVVASGVAQDLVQRQRDIGMLSQVAGDRVDTAALNALQAAFPAYAWIGRADLQGVVRHATNDLLVDRNVAQRPWFAMGLRGPALGDRHRAELLQSLLAPGAAEPLYFIDIAAPVFNAQGQLAGVLAAHVHWRWAGQLMGALVPARSVREQVEVFLSDRSGQIIYPDMPAESAQVPERLRQSEGPLLERWGTGVDFISVAVSVPEAQPDTPLAWRVVVRQPLDTALADLRGLQAAVVAVSLGAALLLLLLAWWGARQISRPLEALTHHARRIEAGDEAARLPDCGGGAELQRLAAALQGMAGTLIARKQALLTSNQQLEQKVAERTAELARSNEALQQLARHDALTGLPNRFATDERMTQEFVRFRRSGATYSVIVLDVDHFKRVNDTHGHAAGDAVLRHVARTLRASHFVGRTGGEEFLVLLPDTPLIQAMEVGDKLRLALAQSEPPVGEPLTLSAGVTEVMTADLDADVAVRRADQGLYRAKQSGRNRVEPA